MTDRANSLGLHRLAVHNDTDSRLLDEASVAPPMLSVVASTSPCHCGSRSLDSTWRRPVDRRLHSTCRCRAGADLLLKVLETRHDIEHRRTLFDRGDVVIDCDPVWRSALTSTKRCTSAHLTVADEKIGGTINSVHLLGSWTRIGAKALNIRREKSRARS